MSRIRDIMLMDLPQVAFRSIGPVFPCRQPARVPPHSVGTGTPPAAARSQTGAPSTVRSSPIELSVRGPSQVFLSSGKDGRPLSSRLGPINHRGTMVTRQRLGTMVPWCLRPLGPIRWSIRIGWTWPTISSGWCKQAASPITNGPMDQAPSPP